MWRKRFSGPLSFGILSTYPPTPCGLATFSAALADGLSANGADVSVVRVADGPPSSSTPGSSESWSTAHRHPWRHAAELLNQSDVAVIQHEYGIYGGVDGDEVVDIIDGLRVPSIVIAHTILKDPTPHQRSVLEAVAAMADQVVVMSEAASATAVPWLRRRPPQGHHHPARRDRPDERRRHAAAVDRPC